MYKVDIEIQTTNCYIYSVILSKEKYPDELMRLRYYHSIQLLFPYIFDKMPQPLCPGWGT